jgi:hypothetical protein
VLIREILDLQLAVKSVFRVSAIILVRFPMYKTIETFQFSQDFLEVFFGIIRARLGGNNNPTVLQFKYALRRILARNQLQGNSLSNVQPITTTIGSVFGLIPVKKVFVDKDFVNAGNAASLRHKTILAALRQKPVPGKWQRLSDSVIFYLGGYIAGKIVSGNDCSSCEQ